MKRIFGAAGLAVIAASSTAMTQDAAAQVEGAQDEGGQDEGGQEVVVTAMRRDADEYNADIPAVGLRRRADFAVVSVSVSGDTRDEAQRRTEIFDMIRSAIVAAERGPVQLAYGDRTLQPLTLANYRDLSLGTDNRPDSQRVTFLVKVPLNGGTDAQSAQAAITTFVKSVKPIGRALIAESGDLTLSVVAPDQYRGAVAEVVAADAKAMAAKLGPEYGVQIEGLSRPVEWSRSGLSDVLLYIPYRLVILPKP